MLIGCLPDGSCRFHSGGEDFGGFCMLGAFSQRAVVSEHSCVAVDPGLDLSTLVLLGCGVLTGWGAAVYAAETAPGEVIAVYGVGGVGINAVQGARHAGARHIVAIELLANKRETVERLGDPQRGQHP